MSEENGLMSKPKKIWNDALKMVKGEDTTQLMETFTAEMTLVAEGLCEDQNQLRNEVNRMMNEEDRRLQKQESRIQELEAALAQQEEDRDRTVKELRNRLAVLEKQEQSHRRGERTKGRNRIQEMTILILVAAAAVIAVLLVWKLV